MSARMARKKFNREQADKLWSNYTKNLVDSLTETEEEGLKKGYSSYEIEKLWQEKTKQKYEKGSKQQDKETDSNSQS